MEDLIIKTKQTIKALFSSDPNKGFKFELKTVIVLRSKVSTGGKSLKVSKPVVFENRITYVNVFPEVRSKLFSDKRWYY